MAAATVADAREEVRQEVRMEGVTEADRVEATEVTLEGVEGGETEVCALYTALHPRRSCQCPEPDRCRIV